MNSAIAKIRLAIYNLIGFGNYFLAFLVNNSKSYYTVKIVKLPFLILSNSYKFCHSKAAKFLTFYTAINKLYN